MYVDQLERMRTQGDACEQEDRDIGNAYLLCQEAAERADRKDQSAVHKRVFGDLDRG